jgi:hypothetical protein
VSIQRIEREFEEELLSLKQQLQVNNLNLKAPTQLQDAQKIVQVNILQWILIIVKTFMLGYF